MRRTLTAKQQHKELCPSILDYCLFEDITKKTTSWNDPHSSHALPDSSDKFLWKEAKAGWEKKKLILSRFKFYDLWNKYVLYLLGIIFWHFGLSLKSDFFSQCWKGQPCVYSRGHTTPLLFPVFFPEISPPHLLSQWDLSVGLPDLLIYYPWLEKQPCSTTEPGCVFRHAASDNSTQKWLHQGSQKR